ncbi:MAG TPA: hypothetical protein VIX18_02875, partial [Nitrospirota bacterium]
MAVLTGIADFIRTTTSRTTREATHRERPVAGSRIIFGNSHMHTSRGGGSAGATAGQTVPAPVRNSSARRHAAAFLFLASFIIFILLASSGFGATPAGTVIDNMARVNFTDGISATLLSANSNTVSVTTVSFRTSAVLELLQYAPTAPGAVGVPVAPSSYSTSGTAAGPFLPQASPVSANGAPISLVSPVPLMTAAQYHAGEAVFIRLIDPDQNLDPAVAESVLITLRDSVTGDTEVIRLTETGLNTGVFTGYMQTNEQPPVTGNGTLNVAGNSRVDAAYTDVVDATDARTLGVMVDPFGMVFSSATGQPVDGAAVTMINAATNLPATVYGDDGVSPFPATVTSGGTAVDSSGKTYTFSPGGYRFPFITPGTYRIEVTPPGGFRAPSTVATAALQALPGGPFAIASPGSRSEDFIVNPGPAIHIDVPVDPAGARLYLTKIAGKQLAGIGDFVPYRLTIENTDALFPVPSVVINDQLPAGFRYRMGSARVNGAVAADPAISADGRTLSLPIGAIAAGSRITVSYVAQIGAGARIGKARNTAVASGAGGAVSNAAFAEIVVTEDLYRSTATIVGRVMVDGCGDKERSEENGLSGIRIYREDGAFVVTDKNGMYHFEGVTPGSHVVQLDLDTIPQKYEIMACEDNTRFAGTPFSQFADVQGGALWRADFHLGLKPKAVGQVGIELRTPVEKGPAEETEAGIRARRDIIKYTVPISVSAVPARNLRLTVLLPQGAEYRSGTSMLGSASIQDPEPGDGSITFRISETPANWESAIRFDVLVPAAGTLGPLSTQALLVADTPEGKGERTPIVDTEVVRIEREYLVNEPAIVLHPQFESGSAALSVKDRKELD